MVEPTSPPTPEPLPDLPEILLFEVNITENDCSPRTSGVFCRTEGEVVSPNGTAIDFVVEIVCGRVAGASFPDTFLDKEAAGCICEITTLGGEDNRKCQCNVCDYDFGVGPLAIECSDDYLIENCTSVDCNTHCDGPCVGDCEQSGLDCPICAEPILLEDLLPGCSSTSDFEDILECIEDFSDPSCYFEDVEIGTVVDCVAEPWQSFTDVSDSTPLISETVGLCFEDVISCINEKVDDLFMGQPNCTRDSGLALTQCLIANKDACAPTCANRNETYAFGGLVEDDLGTCTNVTSSLFDPMCEMISCCTICTSELEMLASCIASDVLELEEACDLPCGGGTNRVRRLSSVPDLLITESAEVSFSRCYNPEDSLTKDMSFWANLADCVVAETFSLFDTLESTPSPTEQPTSSPTLNSTGEPTTITTSAPSLATSIPSDVPSLVPTESLSSSPTHSPTTSTPTESPSAAPTTSLPTQFTTLAPTQDLIDYSYTNLEMRLEGATKDLTEASRIAFESGTEEFYASTITGTPARRRLLVSFDAFRTDVTAKGENLDTQGMTIRYEQVVSFRLAAGQLSEGEMQQYLLNLINEEQQNYIQVLRNKDQDFDTVQSSNARTTDLGSSDDDAFLGLSTTQLIIYILVICLVPCCCFAMCIWMKRYRENQSEKLYDEREKNEMAYEAPAGDAYDAYYAGHESIDQGGFSPDYTMAEEGHHVAQGDAFVDEFDHTADQEENENEEDSGEDSDDSESSEDEEEEEGGSEDDSDESDEDDEDDDSTVSDESSGDDSAEIAFPRHRSSFAGID